MTLSLDPSSYLYRPAGGTRRSSGYTGNAKSIAGFCARPLVAISQSAPRRVVPVARIRRSVRRTSPQYWNVSPALRLTSIFKWEAATLLLPQVVRRVPICEPRLPFPPARWEQRRSARTPLNNSRGPASWRLNPWRMKAFPQAEPVP